LNSKFSSILAGFTFVLMAFGFYFLSGLPRTEFGLSISLYSFLFAGFFAIYWLFKKTNSWIKIFWFGLILRFAVSFNFPQWSDDFVRFLWDGELIRQGENPYSQTPREYMENSSSEYLNQLFPVLNSPDYHSVYTPINQLVFWGVAELSNSSIWKGVIGLRLVLILGEMALFFLFLKLFQVWKISLSKLIIYWLNPLVIMEITGNLHFEGIVLLFLVASIWSLVNSNKTFAGTFWGLAFGIKLLPLILGPAFLRNSILRKSPTFWIGFGIIAFGSMAFLIIDQSYSSFFQSLQLYQGKFEFNASIYYLLREIGFWIKGYNVIADLTKFLSVLTLVLIVFVSFKSKPRNLQDLVDLMVMIYLIYLILQPVVHPWYILPGIGLSIFSRKVTFLIWSFAIIFSYQAYGPLEVMESSLFLTIEYVSVFAGIYWDYFMKKDGLPFFK